MRSSRQAAIEARKLAAFTAKPAGAPNAATVMPPSAGPTTELPVCSTLSVALACWRRWAGTSSGRSAVIAGVKKLPAPDEIAASAQSSGRW